MDKDPRLDNYLKNLSQNVKFNNEMNEEVTYTKKRSLEDKVDELNEKIEALYELIEGLTGKVVMTEGSGDVVDLVIGGHHFRGKMQMVKK